LEEELQPDRFFRANRQYIINIDYVKGFKAFDKVKLQVDLLVPDINHSIIISQETAPVFRKWMYDA
jgi:DNA-binding LytR/AlgR family response regulator